MKLKLWLIAAVAVFLLAACGQKSIDESITLHDHENNEVTIPQDKPVLLFFITTYSWSLCQQQLVELYGKFEELENLDMEIYVVSKDQPEQQKVLHDDLEKVFDRSIPFLSDPEFQVIDAVGMKNNEEDVAYRGYVIIDQDGNVILKKKNDYWGQELDQTVKDVKEAIKK
jgi:peroxiredoxin